MDDANLPDLISAPLSGYVSLHDPIYQNTRRFALSGDDPYYYRGKYATGLGSPHTPTGWVWPLGLIAQALTSEDPAQVADLMGSIAATGSSDGLIHESFDPDDPSRFTRSEFGWANAAFAELLFRSVAGIAARPTHREIFPRILPDYEPPIIVDPFVDQLLACGTLIQALRQSVF
jgi:meiotically up-regulated gene 157 (Mug157) protein